MLGQQVEAKTDDPPYIGRQTANANVSVKDGLHKKDAEYDGEESKGTE